MDILFFIIYTLLTWTAIWVLWCYKNRRTAVMFGFSWFVISSLIAGGLLTKPVAAPTQGQSLNAWVEQECRLKLHRENPRDGFKSFVYDAPGFIVFELTGTTAEVGVTYNRKVADGRTFKGVSYICDIQVPAGTKLVNGMLVP